ncbi:protein kinase domain-containing protein [Legionella spiritensis]|uniref:Serine/threonine-protein kinase D n=2 Tax=Legionella spiritensis TaxID=452 RepID=A0A0W0YYY4_LEGSP|nr:protein kinase [Legionella spiritensis]KTD62089.1 Serine/threonine-protein kinase D [Legionella spiritensis]SNV35694.1 Serine/threonine-protein kinase D [Legionella spiritensis]
MILVKPMQSQLIDLQEISNYEELKQKRFKDALNELIKNPNNLLNGKLEAGKDYLVTFKSFSEDNFEDFLDDPAKKDRDKEFEWRVQFNQDILVIDLSTNNISRPNALLLKKMLENPEINKDGKLDKNEPYLVQNDHGEQQWVCLSHSIQARPSKTSANQLKYQIHGEYIAEGAMGRVKKSPSYIVFDEDNSAKIENPDFVVKIEVFTRNKDSSDDDERRRVNRQRRNIEKEDEITRKIIKRTKPTVRKIIRDKDNRVQKVKWYRYMPNLGDDLLHFKERKIEGKSKLENTSFDDRLEIISNAFQRLHEIHEKGFIHADIKLENMFIKDGSLMPEFADFGLSYEIGSGAPLYPLTGTIPYLAPEMWEDKPEMYTATDVYATGPVAAFLLDDKLTPKILFSEYYKNFEKIIAGQVKLHGHPYNNLLQLPKDRENDKNIFVNFLLELTDLDPQKRPSCIEAKFFFSYMKNDSNPRTLLMLALEHRNMNQLIDFLKRKKDPRTGLIHALEERSNFQLTEDDRKILRYTIEEILSRDMQDPEFRALYKSLPDNVKKQLFVNEKPKIDVIKQLSSEIALPSLDKAIEFKERLKSRMGALEWILEFSGDKEELINKLEDFLNDIESIVDLKSHQETLTSSLTKVETAIQGQEKEEQRFNTGWNRYLSTFFSSRSSANYKETQVQNIEAMRQYKNLHENIATALELINEKIHEIEPKINKK